MPARARWRLRATLFLIWLLGGCAVAAGFAINTRLFGGEPLREVATQLPRTLNDGSVSFVLILSLMGLTGVAFVCYRAWRRRADLGDYWYLGALFLGVYGYFVVWTAGGVAVGIAMTVTDGWGSLLNLPKAVVVAWLFGIMGLMFNALNLLFVVPQVIWCWQRTLHRARLRALPPELPQAPGPSVSSAPAAPSAPSLSSVPAQSNRIDQPDPPELPSPWPRRRILAAWGIGAIGLVLLDYQFMKGRWPIKDLRVDLGQDVTAWMQARGPEHFDSYYVRETPTWVWTVKAPIPDDVPAIFEHGAVRVHWSGIEGFELMNGSEDANDHRIRAVQWRYQSDNHYSHEQGLAFVQATLAQFAREAWQAETLPADNDTIAPTPGQVPSLVTWEALVNQRKPLRWSWLTADVRATLRVGPAWNFEPGEPPSYTVTLRFEERTAP